MSVVVDFTIPTDSFTLHRTLSAEPEMTVEAERLVAHSTEWAFPFFWASGGDFEGFQRALRDDPTVADAAVIEEADDSALYQILWSDDVIDLIDEIINQHANILEAKARGERWRLQLRFAEEEQVSTFQKHFAERGRSFEVNQLYHPTTPRQREYGLTEEQHETLIAALSEGYFNVPRDVSMAELANTLGISSNAVSQRIRRASANLIEHTLTIGSAELTDDG